MTSALAQAPRPNQATTQPGTAPAQGAVANRPPGTPASRPVKKSSSTPQLLRLWTVATAAICLVFALATMLSMVNSSGAINRAGSDTEQLIRMQTIRANLLHADALATNAFLVGGLEPSEQRADYDATMSATSMLITEAAAAQPADAAALGVLNEAVTAYAADMEQARANNRQGYPVGAAYLAEASRQLRATALPTLDNLVAANQQRADNQLSSLGNGWFEVFGIAAGVLLIASFVWTARRFRRVVNVGLLVASVIVVVTWLVGTSVLASNRGAAEELRSNELNVVNAMGEARAAANEAKVQESLRLISHGSGGAAEQAWQQQSERVSQQLSVLSVTDQRALEREWQNYVSAHEEIVELDESGEWEAAVELATGDGEESSNASFKSFDDALAVVISDKGGAAVASLNTMATAPMVLTWILVPALVVAAIAAVVGLRARLREYL
ncbi:hypothetical protein [Microlunatus sp. Y2014]|uniref:hypothetical protein n=1 Tax=Microlunatus sp. Y2014 TaxID=3418488 RepID=UPI003DA772B0